MARDLYEYMRDDLSTPAKRMVAATPSDTVDLNDMSRALYIGTGGDVRVQPAEGAVPVTFKNVPAGTVLPIRVHRVLATGTTATDIVALV